MEPETSTPQLGPEQAPVEYVPNVERAPQPFTPETGIERGAERFEQTAEAAAAAADSAAQSPILPPPVISADPTPVPVDSTTTPLVANDDDLIEKEWVDRAKKIISETKDDPYKREEAVNQLQREYQRQRYGRELGEA